MFVIRFSGLGITALLWATVALGEVPKEKEAAFWKALSNGHASKVDAMLKNTPDLVNLRRSDQSAPLHLAARSSLVDVVKTLIAHKAPINVESKPGLTPLVEAIRRQKKDMCKLLFVAGANPNLKGGFGTSLHVAVMTKNVDIVKLVIDNKAKVNVKDSRGNTPLNVAMDYRVLKIAQLLVLHKADVNIANKQGFTPLLKAVGEKKPDIGIVTLLLKNGANVNAQTGCEKKSALHYAAELGRADIAKLLMDRGADRKLLNNMKKTPAEWAELTAKVKLKKLIEIY